MTLVLRHNVVATWPKCVQATPACQPATSHWAHFHRAAAAGVLTWNPGFPSEEEREGVYNNEQENPGNQGLCAVLSLAPGPGDPRGTLVSSQTLHILVLSNPTSPFILFKAEMKVGFINYKIFTLNHLMFHISCLFLKQLKKCLVLKKITRTTQGEMLSLEWEAPGPSVLRSHPAPMPCSTLAKSRWWENLRRVRSSFLSWINLGPVPAHGDTCGFIRNTHSLLAVGEQTAWHVRPHGFASV